MRLPFGLELTIRKSAGNDLITRVDPSYPGSRWGWWPVIRESFAGAWQRSVAFPVQDVLTQSTVWACATLIASDISKMCIDLMSRDPRTEVLTAVDTKSPFWPVLRKPNHFQNRINFLESWMLSKLSRGNTYVLKGRDNRNVVTDLYVLEPQRVQPLVTPSGDVYYALGQDVLSGVTSASTVVPASEIIHDRMNCLFHPLVGLSPIVACGLAAVQGLKIQHNSVRLFANGASMSGVLTAPGQISESTAKRLEDYWNTNFAGEQNAGKIAVLGDGLNFEKMTMSSVDAQLIDQLKWSDEKVCSTFHVPAYMVGVGAPPNYNNIEALNQQYYTQCLQAHVESIELCLEEGLDVSDYEIELDVDSVMRMDTATKMKTASDGVKGGIFTPNDGRKLFNLKPLKGGETVYLQQQDFPIEALINREPPSNGATPAPSPAPTPAMPPAKSFDDGEVLAYVLKEFAA